MSMKLGLRTIFQSIAPLLNVAYCIKTCLSSNMATCARSCYRLGPVSGYEGRTNEVIFCKATSKPDSDLIFFGGDVQDYKENMMTHRDNVRYNAWDLETTANLLSSRFPTSQIWLVKPSKMHLKTFSVYENFVESSSFGNPTHNNDHGSWKQLCHILSSARNKLSDIAKNSENTCSATGNCEKSVIIIGFSKGCIVLNQLLYELRKAKDDPITKELVKSVTDMYWLDGGHSGGSNTWITDTEVLENLQESSIKVHCHITPYQVQDPMRKWIGKEQKRFVEKLKKLGVEVTNTLHFEQEERSLANHFMVLKKF